MTQLKTILTNDAEIEVAVPEPGEKCPCCGQVVPPRFEDVLREQKVLLLDPYSRKV